MTPPVYSYRRFSTTGRQSRGDSIRRQTDEAETAAAENGWTLDQTDLDDKGRSGFHGANLRGKGKLKKFLALIDEGKVKPGSGLIVESVDRLSRQEPLDALDVLKSIIDKGVFVYTTFDRQTYSRETLRTNPGQLFLLIGQMMTAYAASKDKSKRATAAWEQKQAKAINEGKPVGRNLPGWCQISNGQIVPIPANMEIAREIVRLGITGMGSTAIVKKFHADGVPTWRRSGRWDVVKMKNLMTSRMLLGEYQPCRNRQPYGEPVQNFYPAVCTEQEFYALQSVMNTRKRTTRGRTGRTIANLFTGLAISGDDGSAMRLNSHDPKHKRYVSVDCQNGRNPVYASFPYSVFESAFLRHVAEIDVTETVSPDLQAIASMEGELAAVRARIDQTQAAADAAAKETKGNTFDRYMQMIPKLASQEESLMVRIDTAKAKAHRPTRSTADVAKLVAELETLSDDEKVIGRERLRGAIQGVIEGIKLYIRRQDRTSVCLALVTLRDGLTRTIAIRTTKGQEPISVGVNQPFRAEQLDGHRMADELIAGPLASQMELQARTAAQLLLCGTFANGAEIRPTTPTEFDVKTPPPHFNPQTDKWVLATTASYLPIRSATP